MICSKCGIELAENALFCSKCGQKLSEKQETNTDAVQGGIGAMQFIIAIVIIIVGISGLLATCS